MVGISYKEREKRRIAAEQERLNNRTCQEKTWEGYYKNNPKRDYYAKSYDLEKETREKLNQICKAILEFYNLQETINVDLSEERQRIIFISVSKLLKDLDTAKQLKHEYYEESNRLSEEFRADLEKEFKMTDNPKKDKLFSMAYEEGHSGGFEEVYSVYSRLSELVI